MFIYPTCPGSPENIGGDLAQAAANLRYLQHGSQSPKSDLAKAFTDKDVYRHLVLEKAALDLRDRISPDWKKCPVSEFAGIWFSTSAGNGLYQQWLEKKIPTKAFVGGLMRNNMVSAWYPGELRGKTIEVVDHEGGFILLHRVLWKACGMEMKKPTPPTVSSPEKVTELVESPTPRSADRERGSDRMLLQAKRHEEAKQEAVLRHHHWAQAEREALRQNRSAFLNRHEALGATKQLTVKQLREITRREAQTANSQPDSRGMLFQRKQEEAVRPGKERMEMEFLTRLDVSFRNWKKITVAATIERERLDREVKLEQMD